MTECRKAKDRMIEALYGGLDPAEKELFESHLRACPECAAEYSVLGATLEVMARRERPDPGPAFWDGYYGRLENRLDAELASAPAVPPRPSPARRFARLFSFAPRWAAQAAAAVVLVAAGILIGRSVLTTPARDPSAGGTAVAVPAPAGDPRLVRAENYIERSKILLLALANFDPARKDSYGLDLPRQKEISRGLVTEAAFLKGDLRSPADRRLRELVSDLEVILLQIANLESENDLESVELVQRGVDERGLLMKINLNDMEREDRAGKPAPAAPVKKSTV
jgi:hypothetical protein